MREESEELLIKINELIEKVRAELVELKAELCPETSNTTNDGSNK
jgi:hypothetical protein